MREAQHSLGCSLAGKLGRSRNSRGKAGGVRFQAQREILALSKAYPVLSQPVNEQGLHLCRPWYYWGDVRGSNP